MPKVHLECLKFGDSNYPTTVSNQVITTTRIARAPYEYLGEEIDTTLSDCKNETFIALHGTLCYALGSPKFIYATQHGTNHWEKYKHAYQVPHFIIGTTPPMIPRTTFSTLILFYNVTTKMMSLFVSGNLSFHTCCLCCR